jgi:thiol:disulfide interchange protein
MGNKSRQSNRTQKKSNSYSNSYKVSNTDSRSYQNTDSRSYQNTDSRAYTNVDSRDMSTNVNNVDNRNISDIALDCGINPTDVENYTNNESININQDNSQNIVVSGDGNTLSNITQTMNLTSYGPTVQKCMQDAVSEMSSANKTDLSAESSNTTAAENSGSNTSSNTGSNTSDNTSTNETAQSSSSDQTTSQKSDQGASAKQTAGFGAGGFEIILVIAIIGIYLYMDNNELFNSIKNEFINNNRLQIALGILIISKLF